MERQPSFVSIKFWHKSMQGALGSKCWCTNFGHKLCMAQLPQFFHEKKNGTKTHGKHILICWCKNSKECTTLHQYGTPNPLCWYKNLRMRHPSTHDTPNPLCWCKKLKVYIILQYYSVALLICWCKNLNVCTTLQY